MNFEGFLADCSRQWPSFPVVSELQKEVHPRDRRLAGLCEEIGGAATENKLMLLNLAVRHLQPGEVYVEIGAGRGLSLAGALRGNSKAPAYVCDDFSCTWSSAAMLQQTIERYTAPGQVRVFGMDFRDFVRAAPWQPARVGAYFYDGGHSFSEQCQALELIHRSLSDDALVIIDDTNDPPARAANRLFFAHTPGFQLIADIRTAADCQPTWWNGLQVYRYRKSDAPSRRISRISYLGHRAVWNPLVRICYRAITIPHWWKRRHWSMRKEVGALLRTARSATGRGMNRSNAPDADHPGSRSDTGPHERVDPSRAGK